MHHQISKWTVYLAVFFSAFCIQNSLCISFKTAYDYGAFLTFYGVLMIIVGCAVIVYLYYCRKRRQESLYKDNKTADSAPYLLQTPENSKENLHLKENNEKPNMWL